MRDFDVTGMEIVVTVPTALAVVLGADADRECIVIPTISGSSNMVVAFTPGVTLGQFNLPVTSAPLYLRRSELGDLICNPIYMSIANAPSVFSFWVGRRVYLAR